MREDPAVLEWVAWVLASILFNVIVGLFHEMWWYNILLHKIVEYKVLILFQSIIMIYESASDGVAPHERIDLDN